MSLKKKKIRDDFREKCLKRDFNKCKICLFSPTNLNDLDVHHITDRTLMPNGGYVKENGITLCSKCHIDAEKFHITNGDSWVNGLHPNDLYSLIGSNKELATKKSLEL